MKSVVSIRRRIKYAVGTFVSHAKSHISGEPKRQRTKRWRKKEKDLCNQQRRRRERQENDMIYIKNDEMDKLRQENRKQRDSRYVTEPIPSGIMYSSSTASIANNHFHKYQEQQNGEYYYWQQKFTTSQQNFTGSTTSFGQKTVAAGYHHHSTKKSYNNSNNNNNNHWIGSNWQKQQQQQQQHSPSTTSNNKNTANMATSQKKGHHQQQHGNHQQSRKNTNMDLLDDYGGNDDVDDDDDSTVTTAYCSEGSDRDITMGGTAGEQSEDYGIAQAPSCCPSIPLQPSNPKNEIAIVACGCFWNPQDRFHKVHGIERVAVGYTGGRLANPTSSNMKDHTQALFVEYDPNIISYYSILRLWHDNDDPWVPEPSINFQSAVYFTTRLQYRHAADFVFGLMDRDLASRVLHVKVAPATEFYMAEDYHQYYLRKQRRSAQQQMELFLNNESDSDLFSILE